MAQCLAFGLGFRVFQALHGELRTGQAVMALCLSLYVGLRVLRALYGGLRTGSGCQHTMLIAVVQLLC